MSVCCLFLLLSFEERYFPFKTEVRMVKPVKFTRDSGCLARDEFLVTVKEITS